MFPFPATFDKQSYQKKDNLIKNNKNLKYDSTHLSPILTYLFFTHIIFICYMMIINC